VYVWAQVHEEMHILTPVVPTREFTFLRYCKQMDRGLWVVADVSVDGAPYGIPPSRSRRLPSGCLISDSGNGYSQVDRLSYSCVPRARVLSCSAPATD
jgi:homeobox-leucine zipper protein